MLSPWLLYPFALGLVAAVNPCGFPLLPVYLGMFIGEADGRPRHQRALAAATAALAATGGFVILFGLLGILVQVGVAGVYSATSSAARYVMAACGVLLAAAGVATLLGRVPRLHLPQVRPGLGLRRPLAALVFGISYGVASLGCSLPLFLGGVAQGFTRQGVLRGTADFVAYAIGMGLLLTVVAVVLATSGQAASRPLRHLGRVGRPLGGLALVVVGAYLSLYWISSIANPIGTPAPVRFVDDVQQRVANLFAAHPTSAAAVLFGLLVAVIALVTFVGARRTRDVPTAPSPADRPYETSSTG